MYTIASFFDSVTILVLLGKSEKLVFIETAYYKDSILLNKLDPHSRTPLSYEPHCEKTGLRGFRPGPTQTGLYSHRR